MDAAQNPTFGKFELTREVEKAGIASLYEAIDTETGRKVLLRVLSRSASENPALARFYDTLETGTERRIDHPHVLHLTAAGRIDGRFYMAFAHMEGQQLSRLMAERRLSTEECIAIIRQAADGLRAIHQKHIVHGDVKPANIMVGKDERNQFAVRIASVDLASSAAEAMISVYGELLGTPEYMAPEQIEGRPLSPRTDIYSLGIVAYELFSNAPPFDVENALGYLRAHCDQDPTPLAQLDTSIPSEVSLVVQRMLQRDPRLRYRSAQNLIEDLDRVESRMAGDFSEVAPPGVDSAFAARPAETPAADGRLRMLHVATILTTAVAVLLAVAVFVLSRKMTDLQTQLISLQQPPGTQSQSAPRAPLPQPIAPPQQAPAGDPNQEKFQEGLRRVDRDIEMRRFDEALSRLDVLGARFTDPAWQPKVHAQKARVEFERGLDLQDKGDLDAAMTVFRRVADTYKATEWARQAEQKVPYLLHKKVQSAIDASQWPDAATFARRLAKEHRQTSWAGEALRRLPEVHFRWAEESLANNDPTTAVTQLRIISTEFGDTNYGKRATARLPDAELRWGQQLLGGGEYAQAVEVLDSARRNYRESPQLLDIQRTEEEALAKWAQGLMAAGKVQEALHRLDQLEKEFPGSSWLAKLSGDLAGIHRIARDLRHKAGPTGEPVPPEKVIYTWAVELGSRGKADEARQWFQALTRKYAETEPGRTAAEILANEIYASLGAPQKAPEKVRELMERLVREFPNTEAGRRARTELARQQQAPKDMVYVPAGPFQMGSNMDELLDLAARHGLPRREAVVRLTLGGEIPRHEVSVPAFYIDRCEVTNRQYMEFVDAAGHAPPPSPAWDGSKVKPGAEDHPVTFVSFADAQAYARWAGKRLPTEAEWEKAARGAGTRRYPWGDEFDEGKKANLRRAAAGKTMPVGSFPSGASPFRVMDMVGNVWEWTAGPARLYPGNKLGPIPNFAAERMIVRGASFSDGAAYYTTVTNRFPRDPKDRAADLGFRCVASVDDAAGVTTNAD